VTSTQKIRVVVENPINLACNAEIFIQFTVNTLPDIQLLGEAILCSGQNNVPVTIDAGLQSGAITDFTYQWFKDGVAIVPAATNYTLNVSVIGGYSVLVKNIATTCERTRKVNVVYSEKAVVDTIVISDLTENNTVNVTAKSGLGDYEYSLNNPNGPFQDSGIFENVPSGFHIVYINDKKGCGVISKTISVLGAPKFFTPNGDGFNDFWKIDGSTASFFKNSIVYIFDKFGKLLFQIPNGQSRGWDGTYNGNPMPADDYWFTLEVDNSRNIKGHFSLKR
jgi:gliding motility-associated-like protein